MKNMTLEEEEIYQQGKRDGLKEAAEYVKSINEMHEHEIFRGLNSAFHGKEDEQGWAPLSNASKRLLAGAAKGILRLIK